MARLNKLQDLNLIFDLDGTLVDSLPGICSSLSYASHFCGLKFCDLELREKIGPPISKIMQSLWPKKDKKTLSQALGIFRSHYDRAGCLKGRLYPNAKSTLKFLKTNRNKIFLLTNKPVRPTKRILKHHKIEKFFSEVICPDNLTAPLNNKMEGALFLKRKNRLQPEKTLLIGDSFDDWHAASRASFRFVLASYGYGKKSFKRSPGKKILELQNPRDLIFIFNRKTHD